MRRTAGACDSSLGRRRRPFDAREGGREKSRVRVFWFSLDFRCFIKVYARERNTSEKENSGSFERACFINQQRFDQNTLF